MLVMEIYKIWNGYWKKILYDKKTFIYVEENNNLENMKWLLGKKFLYDEKTFSMAAKNGIRKYEMVIR